VLVKLQVNPEAITHFCHEHGVVRLELFGSAARGDLRHDSDVDLLCTLRPDLPCGLFGWVSLKLDFEKLFGRRVDLVSRAGIERSENPYRKHAILSSAVLLYVEG
jgi:predicted nucleotidyltransferase